MISVKKIGSAEYDKIATTPQSPPSLSDEKQSEAFSNEFWSFVESVRSTARIFQAEDSEGGEGDYWINNGFEGYRRVSIEILSPKLLSLQFVAALMDTIRTSGPEYRIDVMHNVEDEPLFFLLIYANEVLGVCDDGFVVPTWLNE